MLSISLTKFKQMTSEEVLSGPCMEITSDGKCICYVVVGAKEEMKNEITTRMGLINASRGVK